MARVLPIAIASASRLRADWSTHSLATVWSFPSDWNNPAAEAVCEAIAADADAFPAAERLGRARAAAGVGLGETLADIDQLVALVPARYAEVLRRAVSLGWADRFVGPGAEVADALTGLVSKEYLELRLAEVYQQCAADRLDVGSEYALVVVRVDLRERSVWQRVLPMILVGESLRVVFDGGETLARVGEPMAVALVRRREVLSRQVPLLSRLIASRTESDPEARIAPPRVWVESLPTTYASARALIAELGR